MGQKTPAEEIHGGKCPVSALTFGKRINLEGDQLNGGKGKGRRGEKGRTANMGV